MECHLQHWVVFWPGFDFAMQLLPQPHKLRGRFLSLAAKREQPEQFLDDKNQPCLFHHTWFWSGLPTLVMYWKVRLIPKGKKEVSQVSWAETAWGLANIIMLVKSHIHSSPSASLSTYLNPWHSGPWRWPAHEWAPMWCGSRLLPLEECKKFWNPVTASSIQNTLSPPPTWLPIHSKCWRDTYVLYLKGSILEQRVPSAQKNNTNFLVIAVGTANTTSTPTSEPAPAALEWHLGAEGTQMPSCGHLL